MAERAKANTSHSGDEMAPSTPAPAAGSSSAWAAVSGVVRTMRPHQWVKNLFVLAPVVFAKNITHPDVVRGAISAFAIYCLLAGAVYTLNDLADVEADRVHPVKRHRPIASGVVPSAVARAVIVLLLVFSTAGALMLPWRFGAVAAGYFAINLAYSSKLKKYAYLDVSCIAAGFVMRVLAGGFATNTPVSGYMIACTALLALFLGFGKRRHELASAGAVRQRKALKAYSPRALSIALALTGLATVGTYLAYTFDPHTRQLFQSEWLWLTTVHPVVGVFRFLQLVGGRPKAESPTQEMLRDSPFVFNLVVWVVEVVVIVYRLRPS